MDIAAGSQHGLALKADGTVWVWGRNNCGQLGLGYTNNGVAAVQQIPDLNNVIAVAAYANHSMSLKADGTVWMWGYNHYGQLGDGTTLSVFSPQQVDVVSNIVAIAAGSDGASALQDDGTVWMWGRGHSGRLGNGTTPTQSLPVKVVRENGEDGLLVDVVRLSIGGAHRVVEKSDGSIWCWGVGMVGQLGNGECNVVIRPVFGKRIQPRRIIIGIIDDSSAHRFQLWC